MGADIAHTPGEAGARGIRPPGGLLVAPGLHGLHQPVLRVFDHHLANLAQLAGADHLARLADGGIARVGVRERKQPRAGFDETNQLLALGDRQREGLVTDDVNAGLEKSPRHGTVQVVRSRDDDKVDAVVAAGAFGGGHLHVRGVSALEQPGCRALTGDTGIG